MRLSCSRFTISRSFEPVSAVVHSTAASKCKNLRLCSVLDRVAPCGKGKLSLLQLIIMKPLGKAYWEVCTRTSYTFYVAVILHINNMLLPQLHITVLTRVKICAFILVSSKSPSMSDIKPRSSEAVISNMCYALDLLSQKYCNLKNHYHVSLFYM